MKKDKNQTIMISSERLNVKIAVPHESPNESIRFDRAGFVTSVMLDSTHEFCTAEPPNLDYPCTGGIGLCSEITCHSTFDDAAVGERFAKFGVGLLKKPDNEPYVYHGSYDCEPFEITWEAKADSAVFTTKPRACLGYALSERKSLSVAGNELSVQYEFKNTGEKDIIFNECCHNFVSLTRLPLGPGYHISMPSIGPQDGKEPLLKGTIYGSGSGFTFSGYCETAAMMTVEEKEIDKNLPFFWALTHSGGKLAISEHTSFVPAFVNVWCIDHIISPMVNHTVSLSPGDMVSWSRVWKFEDFKD
jgi:hypothetical protein